MAFLAKFGLGDELSKLVIISINLGLIFRLNYVQEGVATYTHVGRVHHWGAIPQAKATLANKWDRFREKVLV